MRQVLKKVTLALVASAACSVAIAQADKWPSRSITIVGGFPNGSGVDIYARKIGEALTAASDLMGSPVPVHVWDSRSQESWQGPPAVWASWPA